MLMIKDPVLEWGESVFYLNFLGSVLVVVVAAHSAGHLEEVVLQLHHLADRPLLLRLVGPRWTF